MRKQLTLYAKLAITVTGSVVVVAAFSFYEIRTITYFNTLFDDFSVYDIERIRTLQETRLTEQSLRIRLTQYDLDIADGSPIGDTQKLLISRNLTALQTSEESYVALVQRDQQTHTSAGQLAALSAQTQQVTHIVSGAAQQGNSLASDTKLAQLFDQLEATLSDILATERKDIADEGTSARAATTRLQRATIAMSIMAVLLTGGLVILFVVWISRPIFRLKSAADRIAGGDLSELHMHEAPDVFGQLAASLNQMSIRMRDSYRRLSIKQQQDESILDNMGEGVIAIDSDAKLMLANQVAKKYLELGKTSADTYLQQFNIYAADDTSRTPLTPDQRPGFVALQTGRPYGGTFSYYRKDKRQALLHIIATPIVIDRRVVGATMLFRDVTKEHEIDRMKTEFISLASHQLRTPLSTIKWFSEMLLAGDAGALRSEQVGFITNISDATERMIELVNALLDISRIESGRIIIAPEPTDIRKLIENATHDAQSKIQEKRQKLIISINDTLPKILLDPRLMNQVFMNLLTNAVKYTPAGGEITIMVSRHDNTVIVQVSDTGYGIPKDDQQRIFERFFRASNTARLVTDGTGLGLYLSKTIVESSGGKIWFESEEGKGSTFWLSMPMHGMKPKKGEVTLHG